MDKPLKFYDLNVKAYPEGAASLACMARAYKTYGYDGICVSNHSELLAQEGLKSADNIEIYRGVEVVPEKMSELRHLVDRYRNKVDVLIVHGGDEAINRAACEDGRVDILAHPQDGKTGGINHIIARLAADHQVAIEFGLSPIILNKGGGRVKALSFYRANLALLKKYGAPFVLTCDPLSTYDIRDVRSVLALARLFGMSEKDAIHGLSRFPGQILRRRSPAFIRDGVELLEA